MCQLDPADNAFRKALTNLRYKACSSSDIAIFRSRITSQLRGRPHVSDPVFRNVSVITSRNVNRDAMKLLLSDRFAQDTAQELMTFYSKDRWNTEIVEDESTAARLRAFEASVEPTRSGNDIDERLRNFLWNLPPNSTGHRAGMLRLCYGMPVMLKHNEATELCVTNSAEATVCGWDSDDTDDKHKVLKTLFVQLTSPARRVIIAGLPENVIPLSPIEERIYYKINKTKKLPFTREQVPVLPNFAMSDFCSQGRTRPANVVDLKKCQSHQSAYTCLSRSSSLTGTVIVGDFSSKHFFGGADPDLMREFRDLEILSDVTTHKYEGTLPFDMASLTRRDVIKRYQAWKGIRFVPDHIDGPLNWSCWPIDVLKAGESGMPWGSWTVDIEKNAKKRKHGSSVVTVACRDASIAKKARTLLETKATINNSNNNAKMSSDVSRTGRNISNLPVRGCLWDVSNWSCAYDVFIHFLWNTVCERSIDWSTNNIVASQEPLQVCLRGFQSSNVADVDLDAVCDQARDVLACLQPMLFPRQGAALVDIEDLFATMFPTQNSFSSAHRECSACLYCESLPQSQLDSLILQTYPALWEDLSPTQDSTLR